MAAPPFSHPRPAKQHTELVLSTRRDEGVRSEMTAAVVIAHHEQSVVALFAVRHEVSGGAAIEIFFVLQEFAECFLRYAKLFCGVSRIL